VSYGELKVVISYLITMIELSVFVILFVILTSMGIKRYMRMVIKRRFGTMCYRCLSESESSVVHDIESSFTRRAAFDDFVCECYERVGGNVNAEAASNHSCPYLIEREMLRAKYKRWIT